METKKTRITGVGCTKDGLGRRRQQKRSQSKVVGVSECSFSTIRGSEQTQILVSTTIKTTFQVRILRILPIQRCILWKRYVVIRIPVSRSLFYALARLCTRSELIHSAALGGTLYSFLPNSYIVRLWLESCRFIFSPLRCVHFRSPILRP